MRYLKRFDEYNEMRNQQPESERQIKPRGKKLIRGHWVRTFKYEVLCSYFDILRGIPNANNNAAPMGDC